jgi:CDP-diacylglycerol--glycerol-3-phosphate 3-phosphatidyltransferase
MNCVTAFLYAVVSLTDMLDGYLARKYDIITDTGKLIDPLADKLLVSTALIMLLSLDRVPAWVVALIIGRELAVTGLGESHQRGGVVIQASNMAKYKTIIQAVAGTLLIAHYEYFMINFHRTGMVFLWLAFVITLWTGFDYFWKYFSVQINERG